MLKIVHRVAAIVALLCIVSFFSATLVVELFGPTQWVASVKSMIVTPGLWILIPALAVTGASGFAISKQRRGKLVERKQKRMPFIALNGIFILLPAAIMLDRWASSGSLDTAFYLLQVLELAAGAVNIVLMSLNMRDGMRLGGRFKPNTGTAAG